LIFLISFPLYLYLSEKIWFFRDNQKFFCFFDFIFPFTYISPEKFGFSGILKNFSVFLISFSLYLYLSGKIWFFRDTPKFFCFFDFIFLFTYISQKKYSFSEIIENFFNFFG